MKDLPRLRPRPIDWVKDYITMVLAHPGQPDHLHALIPYEDGHYRAIFTLDYFTLAPGQAEPSRSQWNSLKKKMKRHFPGVFVFRDHGLAACSRDVPCCYVDFGFFTD